MEEMFLALIRVQRRRWIGSLSRRAVVGKSSTFWVGKVCWWKGPGHNWMMSKKMGYRAFLMLILGDLLLPGWFACDLDMSILHRLTTLLSGLWECRVMTSTF